MEWFGLWRRATGDAAGTATGDAASRLAALEVRVARLEESHARLDARARVSAHTREAGGVAGGPWRVMDNDIETLD